MTMDFEQQKNTMAFLYTIAILALLFLLFIIVKWQHTPPPIIAMNDLIEVNLGNDLEGFGEEQPMIKGEKGKAVTELAAADPAPAATTEEAEHPVDAIEDNSKDEPVATIAPTPKVVAPVKTTTTPPKNISTTKSNAAAVATKPSTITSTAPKAATPQKPKLTYNGPANGSGNNDTEDNAFRTQGKNKDGKGDFGSPEGNKDSYGNTPGGKIGGPKVLSGNRSIIRNYSFTGDLPKATIYAQVLVDAAGNGSLQKLVKPSTSFSSSYSNAVKNYLRNIDFNKSNGESVVTIRFDFVVQQ